MSPETCAGRLRFTLQNPVPGQGLHKTKTRKGHFKGLETKQKVTGARCMPSGHGPSTIITQQEAQGHETSNDFRLHHSIDNVPCGCCMQGALGLVLGKKTAPDQAPDSRCVHVWLEIQRSMILINLHQGQDGALWRVLRGALVPMDGL